MRAELRGAFQHPAFRGRSRVPADESLRAEKKFMLSPKSARTRPRLTED
jgi:hypothetical protein